MHLVIKILTEFNPWSVCFRLLLAAVLGGCIGAERGRHGRPAGLRTYILVSVGACITTLIGLYCTEQLSSTGDPLRIGAQVVSGIGFLGAGTIMSDRNTHITGLTTAAGLWTAACVGLSIGVGFYWGALVAFSIMLVAIVALSRLEKVQKINRSSSYYYLEVAEVQGVNSVCRVLEEIGNLQIVLAKSGLCSHVGIILSVKPEKDGHTLLQYLQRLDGVVIAIPTTL